MTFSFALFQRPFTFCAKSENYVIDIGKWLCDVASDVITTLLVHIKVYLMRIRLIFRNRKLDAAWIHTSHTHTHMLGISNESLFNADLFGVS